MKAAKKDEIAAGQEQIDTETQELADADDASKTGGCVPCLQPDEDVEDWHWELTPLPIK